MTTMTDHGMLSWADGRARDDTATDRGRAPTDAP
jgi:hypothetical protein